MTREQFEKILDQLPMRMYQSICNSAPVRSGALMRSIYIKQNVDGFSIIIPKEYMQYTEEPWNPNFTKDGRHNPNEYWLKEEVERIVNQLRSEMNV